MVIPRPNFYDGVLGMLHIGNGACCVMTMSGLLLTMLGARYADMPERKRMAWAMGIAAVFAALGAVSWHFWIVSKIGATPPWVFFVIALSTAMYAILSFMASHRLDGWFALIRPAGTAKLTAYIVPCFLWLFRCDRNSAPRRAHPRAAGATELYVLFTSGDSRDGPSRTHTYKT